jgi:hypothetical protein
MDILVAGEPLDALFIIVHRDFVYGRGKALFSKMRERFRAKCSKLQSSPRAPQKSSPAKPSRDWKNVIAKCYGADISRERKLLENKKRQKTREAHRGALTSARKPSGSPKSRRRQQPAGRRIWGQLRKCRDSRPRLSRERSSQVLNVMGPDYVTDGNPPMLWLYG